MREVVKVKIVNKSINELPKYAHPGDSGVDVRANIKESVTLRPLERTLIPTGLYVELPEGYEIQVRPRSGLALKRGLTILNTPGSIDEQYRGEIGVIVINLDSNEQVIEPGERIAQLVLAKTSQMDLIQIDEVNTETERSTTKYGDSGRF